MMRKPIIVVADPAAVRQIFVKDNNKYLPALGRPLISGSAQQAEQSMMSFTTGPLWATLRGAVQPMFHTKPLMAYAETINEAVDQLLDNLKSVAESGSEVNIVQQMSQLTMQVIGAAAFGIDFDCQQGRVQAESPVVSAARAVFRTSVPTFWTLATMWTPSVFMPLVKRLAHRFPTKNDVALSKANEYMFDVSAALIENSQKASGSVAEATSDWLWFKRKPDNPYKDTVPADNSAIAMLLKANNKASGNPLSPMQVAAQSKLFISAGFETTALTLTYCIYLLSKHPEHLAKLQQEVDELKEHIIYDDLQCLPYTAAVVSESLRLYPPVTTVVRRAAQNVKVGGYEVPRGTEVNLSIWCLHHSEQWWQDAETFKPERWLGDETGGDMSGGFAYIPFGVGPRHCIGYKLALEEAAIALARIYQRFTFTLAPTCLEPLQLVQAITISPKGGLPVRVTTRPKLQA
ncbi:hypothetical protein ABBQ38_005874 [Trebouxia sp. C0009 RCD-2024]